MSRRSAAKAAGTDEIKFWIMSCGCHSLVLEPESLRQEIRVEMERMANRYEGRILTEKNPMDGHMTILYNAVGAVPFSMREL